MTGRTVVITGGNSGIGKATACGLAARGARVMITARDATRGSIAVEEIKRASGNDAVDCVELDLCRLASVRACAAELLDRLDTIHVLDLNAGGLLSRRQVTVDGFETQFQANHLGHFLLTKLLLARLEASAPARVVVVSSVGHVQARHGVRFDDLQWEQRPYRGSAVYGATKLMNILFASELARRLRGTNVVANAVHPGFVRSRFAMEGDTRAMRLGLIVASPFARSPERGARGIIWLASSPAAEGETGGYWVYRRRNVRRKAPSPAAQDADAARKLWQVSEALTGCA